MVVRLVTDHISSMERAQEPAVEEPDSESDIHIENISIEELGLTEIKSGAGQWSNQDKKALSAVALGQNQVAAAPVYGSVSVNASENVQFGNNTYFNGPVIIRQVVHSKSGHDNASYTKTEDRDELRRDPPSAKQPQDVERRIQLKTWHKLALAIAGVGGIIAVVIAVFVSRNSDPMNFNEDNFEDYSNGSLTDPLQIPSFHLRLVERSQWIAQPVEEKLGVLELPAPWAIISHTATENCSRQSECVYRVRTIQTYHIESKGWSDIAYNFLVGGDGSAYVGRGWDHAGAHTLGYNTYSIGIAFIGTFNTEEPPHRQVEACRKLLQLGVKLGKLAPDYRLFGHRQLSSTLSPGDTVYKIISQWPHFSLDVIGALPKKKRKD